MAQFAHRIVSAIVAVILIAATIYVWRGVRGRGADARPIPGGQTLLGLVGTAAALYAVQVIVGALQIWTTLAAWTVALHLALGAAIWALAGGGHLRGLVRGTSRGPAARPMAAPACPGAAIRSEVGTGAADAAQPAPRGASASTPSWHSPSHASSSCCW